MTKQEAVDWAVSQLADSFAYEFYTNKRKATEAAQAMTLLSGNKWAVEPLMFHKGYAVIPKA